ncbi:MAG: M42 family metallopeptidase [Bradymonadales bacterium]|nr:M42 family metallopeptidase [Bradymonadales bacterium]
MELLAQLSETPGASGREDRIRNLIKEMVEPHADNVTVDPLGNLICLKRATRQSEQPPRRVMVSCHMDEIAFYVRRIDDNGFIRIKEVGGFDTRNLYARQVLIQGREDILGVLNPGVPPIHLAKEEDKKKSLQINDFYIDTGLSKEELTELARTGDPVTLLQTFRTMGKLATGKAMDNRAACWVGIRLLQEIQDTPNDLYVAFTTQEEVGLRGAKTCAYSIEPQIGIAVDVTLAVDTPGTPKDEGVTELGKGVAIKVMDSGSISDPALLEEFIELARQEEIKHQLEILPRGGTDAGGIQLTRGGVRVITLSVPCRYVHTVTETIHQEDLRNTVDLLIAYLSR